MTMPPIFNPRDVGRQAHDMANNCEDKRLAMTLQCVAIGSMIVMAAASAAHVIKDLFRNSEHRDRSR